ncbi:CsbD family protein [Pigmentiphaga sp. NML080357]|uniref:CsbD family protein n=1 Tax=Pigmentiphaga sp. NML080357 TaxID=2008675 RepID=UPI000B410E7B|nr:CsbD family protein [Pigmentiphaga sp. NML080357]OVZ55088.1 CsbD family protein [Pigmentiphaga sp. NML080357]
MDKDRIKGAAKEVKGTVKETAGKLTGNRSGEMEGKIEKSTGTVQRNFGQAKDRLRDEVNKK